MDDDSDMMLSRYRLDFDISIRLSLFFAILGSKGMMFPIWKDACSPVQPLRTVILDLHGTAVAADLDMSSLLNYMSGGTSNMDLKVVLDSSTQMSGLQRARARRALTPWLYHGSHSAAHTDYDYASVRLSAGYTLTHRKHKQTAVRSSSRVARRSRTHTSLLSHFGHAHFCAFPAALFV